MIVSHEICGASIVTEYIYKAEQVRIITMEAVSCLHSVNGTICQSW